MSQPDDMRGLFGARKTGDQFEVIIDIPGEASWFVSCDTEADARAVSKSVEFYNAFKTGGSADPEEVENTVEVLTKYNRGNSQVARKLRAFIERLRGKSG